MKRFYRLAIGVFLSGVTTTAYASGGDTSLANVAIDEVELAQVETLDVFGYRLNMLGTSISAAEGIVGSQEISSRPLLRSGEILEFVPGMVVTQHSGSGKANQYFLRGFNLDHGTDFSTMIDGMPVNMRSHGHGQGYTDLNFIIPELVDEIHYRKGPYYAEIGDFSGAGAAEFSIKKSLAESQISVMGGEFGYRRLYAAYESDLAAGKVMLGLETQTYDGPWTDINEAVGKTNLIARYSTSMPGGTFALTLMGYENQWNAADQIPTRAVERQLIDRLGSLDDDVGGESSRYSLSAQWQNPDWKINAYLIDSQLNLFSNFTYFLDDPIRGDEFEQVDDRQLIGGEIKRDLVATLMDRPVTHMFGIQVRHDRIDEVGLHKTRARERLKTTRSDAIDETSVALFAQSDLQLTESFRGHLGVRRDYLSVDVDSNLSQNSGDADDHMTNLKAGFSYQVSELIETYVNIGQGFHSNDARGATIAIDPTTAEIAEPVDLFVRSEGAEIGIKFFNHDRYNISASVWHLELDSELLFVGDAGNTEASRASVRSGFELASYLWFADGWSVDTEWAWTKSRFTQAQAEEGKYVDGSLPFVASAGITYAPAQAGFHGNLRLRHFGARHLDSFGLHRGGEASVVNMGIGYRWGRSSLGLDVFNLLGSDDNDIEYFYSSRLAGEPEGGVEDLHFHPIEPRSLRLRFEYWF